MPRPAIPRGALPARETKLLADPGLVVAGDYEFEGYASLFGVPDLGRDVVVAGAFADSLARRGASGIRLSVRRGSALKAAARVEIGRCPT